MKAPISPELLTVYHSVTAASIKQIFSSRLHIFVLSPQRCGVEAEETFVEIISSGFTKCVLLLCAVANLSEMIHFTALWFDRTFSNIINLTPRHRL